MIRIKKRRNSVTMLGFLAQSGTESVEVGGKSLVSFFLFFWCFVFVFKLKEAKRLRKKRKHAGMRHFTKETQFLSFFPIQKGMGWKAKVEVSSV